jgi:hypothetical protein
MRLDHGEAGWGTGERGSRPVGLWRPAGRRAVTPDGRGPRVKAERGLSPLRNDATLNALR